MMAKNVTVPHFGFAVVLAFGISTVASAEGYPDAVMQDKPVAYFRFEEDSGIPVRDILSNERARRIATSYKLNVSTDGALLTRKGTRNQAARFTGSSYVSVTAVPDVYEFDGAVSIEFWIRPTKGGGTAQDFIAKGEFTRTGCNYYLLYFQDKSDEFGRLRFGIADGHIDQTSKLIENKFTHVVVTFDPARRGDNTKMYINGQLDAAKRIEGKPRSTKGTPLSENSPKGHPPNLSNLKMPVNLS